MISMTTSHSEGQALADRLRRELRERNQAKRRCHTAVSNARRDGKLVRPNRCENCDRKTVPGGASKIVAHHENYNKPLDILWLCTGCHSFHHTKLWRIEHELPEIVEPMVAGHSLLHA